MLGRPAYLCRVWLVGTLVFAFIAAPTSQAQPPVAPPPAPRDIRLTNDGQLVGLVVNHQGRSVARQVITVAQLGGKAGETTTDQHGRFQAEVKPGAYLIGVGGRQALCRLWTAETAPPRASQGVLLVVEGRVVRGQGGGLFGPNTVPLLIGGAVLTAAIVIPLSADSD